MAQWTDHVVNAEGAIQIPVFHKNHPCLRLKRSASVETSAIDVIRDSSINDFAFLMPIKVGTPPVINLVAIDTGSTLSWVQCQPCKQHCHKQDTKAGQIFDPSNSTTFRTAHCKSRECLDIKDGLGLDFANCMEKEDTCLYSMTYGSRWAYTAGKVAWDNFIVGSEQNTIINSILLFGCSLDVEYSHYEAGILGFGTSIFSFFEQISELINYKSFSYCLPSEEIVNKGYMILGDYNRQGVDGYTHMFASQQTPTYSLIMTGINVANGQSLMATGTSSEMIVDSGSFWTFLFPGTFNRLDEAITQAMAPLNFTRDYIRGPSYICFISQADLHNFKGRHTVFRDWSTLPTMVMTFAGGLVTPPLQPKNLFHNDPEFGLCMNFRKTGAITFQVLGNRVTGSFETIFDIPSKRFGFRYGAC